MNDLKEEARMIRVSECRYFIALVYTSLICIEETEAYLERKIVFVYGKESQLYLILLLRAKA